MSYSNFDIIINQSIDSLLKTEFTLNGKLTIPIIYYDVFRKEDLTPGEYIRWYSDGSEDVGQSTGVNTRKYNYELSYYFRYSGKLKKERFENRISDRTNHLYYFLLTKIDNHSDGYKWHHLEVEPIGKVLWGVEDIENTDDIAHVDMIFSIFRSNEIPAIGVIDGGEIV